MVIVDHFSLALADSFYVKRDSGSSQLMQISWTFFLIASVKVLGSILSLASPGSLTHP